MQEGGGNAWNQSVKIKNYILIPYFVSYTYLTAHIIGLGGRSHGTAEPNITITPKRRRTPMVWFPLRVPSHIFRKT